MFGINSYTISAILTVGIFYFLAGYVYLKGRNRPLSKIFALQTFLMGTWCLFFVNLNLYHPAAIIFVRIFYISAILNIPVFTHFCFTLIGVQQRKIEQIWLRLLYIFSFLFALFVPTNLFMQEIVRLRLHYSVSPGLLFWIFPFAFIGTCLYNFYRLLRAFFRSTGSQKNQYKYFILAFNIAFIGALLHFLPILFGISEPFPHDFLLISYAVICTYAIIRYHLLDIKVAITRAGIFLLLYTAVLGVPFYVGYILRRHLELWPVPIGYALFFASLGPLIYRKLQSKAESILLAQQRHYQHLLLQAAGGMVREHNLRRLLKLIVHLVKKIVKIRYAAIFSFDKEKNVYQLMSSRGYKFTSDGVIFDKDSPLINFMRNTSFSVIPEEMPSQARNELREKLKTSFGLVVPSVVEQKVLGFLILGEKVDKSSYSYDDTSVFNILSRQAALAIENCLFFEGFKQVQEELFQAERLASIGGIADGVAHQIKNRLNHFSLASGELKLAIMDFLDKNPEIVKEPKMIEIFEYLKTLAESISLNVKRTDGIVRGILNFARTSEKDKFFGYIPLNEMVNAAIELLVIKHEIYEIPIEQNIASVEQIWGVRAQLNEVIYNLLDNAYEATQEVYEKRSPKEYADYHPKITIAAKEDGDSYIIIVSDNGCGIKEEDRPKMFAPFFTTKSSYKSGSGIGMYVVRRIVEENHKGKIWFESGYTKGTTFYVILPKMR